MESAGEKRSPRDYYYGEVLQLPPGTKHPDLYELLGIPYFESDHDTILRAALERLRVLEACEADPRPAYRKTLSQLMTEVRDAQMTLLDPERRRAYEAKLTGAKSAKRKKKEEPKEYELPLGHMFADRYRVMGVARRGALGVVHDALDKNLRTRVHLSVLAPHLSGSRKDRRPVEQAARAAAALDHPNLLRFDEVGEEDGCLFVRARAADGKNLLEVIEATPQMRLDPDDARRIACQIAEALRYTHDQGAAHGDLRPHNIFVDANGRVQVADVRVARAFQDVAGVPGSRYREPEKESTPAADIFSLGCLLYQMLAGMPPFAADARSYIPKPLPDDVPADLSATVMRMLARKPEKRPESVAELIELLTPPERRGKKALLAGVAAAVVLVLGAGAFFVFGGDGSDVPVKELAWQLIAENKYAEAADALRRARAAEPADASLIAPLVKAIEGEAEQRRENDPWSAQLLLREAQELMPAPEREAAFAAVRENAVARLAGVVVEAPTVAASARITIRAGDVPLARVKVGDDERTEAAAEYEFDLGLPDGAHEVAYAMEDTAGNPREGTVAFVLDTVAPTVEFVAPEDGAQLRDKRVEVRVTVEDANPPESVRVSGQSLALVSGVAEGTVELGDGNHEIEVVVRDRAGHESRDTINIVVDTKAPDITLASRRLVTGDGSAVIRGRVGPVRSLTVAGETVQPAADGAFEAAVRVTRDTAVAVEAVGVTGIRRRIAVRVVMDDTKPTVDVKWTRRSSNGTLLFGSREMAAGAVVVPLAVEDKTKMTFEPDVGRIEAGGWKLPPTEGRQTATLVVRDEAGNEGRITINLEGRRALPKLSVKCTTPAVTNDEEAQLEIEAEGTLLVQGKPAQPGKMRVPLPQGRQELIVRTSDVYGNESRWSKEILVDRAPPKLSLVGPPERGIGEQELVFESDEPLASVTCFGRTVDAQGKRVSLEADLRQGKKKLTVVARDRAGNSSKHAFTLMVKNRVLLLDGRSSVKVNLPKDFWPSKFTIECWVRGYTPVGTQAVLSNYERGGTSLMWCSSKSTLPYAVILAETSGRQVLNVKKGWKWEEWTHVALSFDGKRVRYYVGGSLQHSFELKERISPSKSPLYIGADARNKYQLRGAIDEVRISDNARYTRGFSPTRYLRRDSHTLALYRFDTLEGKLHPDSSGRGLHGESLGAPRLHEER